MSRNPGSQSNSNNNSGTLTESNWAIATPSMDAVVLEGIEMESKLLIAVWAWDLAGRSRRMVGVPEIGVPTRMKHRVLKEEWWWGEDQKKTRENRVTQLRKKKRRRNKSPKASRNKKKKQEETRCYHMSNT